MASKNLKEFAASLGFENKNNRFFGDYRGYCITLSESSGRKNLIIGMSLPRDDSRLNQIVEFIENNKKESRIVEYSIHPSHVSIAIQDVKGVIERLTKLMDDGIKLLMEKGIPGNSICWYCNAQITSGAEKVQVNEAVVPMHSGCVESFSQHVEQAAEEFHKEQKNYGRGFIGALIGGIVGAIPWVVVYLLGYLYAVLGILIGFASKKGYEIFGGKPGKAKAWMVLFVVIVVVFVGQFIGDVVELNKLFQEEGLTDYELSDVIEYHKILIQEEAEYRAIIIENLIKGLAFAIAGAVGIFIELKKEGKGNIATVKRLS